MSETTRDCQEESFARGTRIAELEAERDKERSRTLNLMVEIERLRADVSSLTAAHDMWHSQWSEAQKELDRLRLVDLKLADAESELKQERAEIERLRALLGKLVLAFDENTDHIWHDDVEEARDALRGEGK